MLKFVSGTFSNFSVRRYSLWALGYVRVRTYFCFLGSSGSLSGFNNSITAAIGQFFLGGSFIGPLPFDGKADLKASDLSVMTRRDYKEIAKIVKNTEWVHKDYCLWRKTIFRPKKRVYPQRPWLETVGNCFLDLSKMTTSGSIIRVSKIMMGRFSEAVKVGASKVVYFLLIIRLSLFFSASRGHSISVKKNGTKWKPDQFGWITPPMST